MKRLVFVCCLFLVACTNVPANPSAPLGMRDIDVADKSYVEGNSEIKTIWEKGKEGKIQESEFRVFQHTIEDVKGRLGEPEKVDKVGSHFYAHYEEGNIVFGYNQQGEVFDIRSYSFSEEITYEMLKNELGEATKIRELIGEKIYIYEIGKIELKWIVSNSTNTVHHISVFYPERAERDYILDIKGESNQLSASAWENMQNWRRSIVDFSMGKDHVYINGPNEKMVALTFDDGPDDVVTLEVANILEKYNVQGNFFFLGEKMLQHQNVVKEVDGKGHHVFSHSFHHIDLTALSEEGVKDELVKASDAIYSVINKEPLFVRTPYGETDDVVAEAARKLGYSIILWSIDTLDWSQKDPSNIANNVLANVRNGDIILLHSNEEQMVTVDALPAIIEGLLEAGFQIVDLETLLRIDANK